MNECAQEMISLNTESTSANSSPIQIKVEDDEESKISDLQPQSDPSAVPLGKSSNLPVRINTEEGEGEVEGDAEGEENLEDSDSYEGQGWFWCKMVRDIRKKFHRISRNRSFTFYNFFLLIYFLLNLIMLIIWQCGRVRLNVFLLVLLISTLILGLVKILQKLNQMLLLPAHYNFPFVVERGRDVQPHQPADSGTNGNSEQASEIRPEPRIDQLTEAQRLNYARLRLHIFNLRLQLFLNNLGLNALARNGGGEHNQEFENMFNQVVLLTSPHLILGFQQQQSRGLSPTDIENFPTQKYTRKIKLDNTGQGEQSEEHCIICLDTFSEELEIRRLPCFHFFHKECIDKWLERQADCPLCKHSLVSVEF